MKRIEECARWDKRQAEKKHVIWNVFGWIAYIAVICIIITIIVPPFFMFYVQSEIRAGNWVNVDQAANITMTTDLNMNGANDSSLNLEELKQKQKERRE